LIYIKINYTIKRESFFFRHKHYSSYIRYIIIFIFIFSFINLLICFQYVSEFSIFPISVVSLKKSENYLNDEEEYIFRAKIDQFIKVFTKTDVKQKGLNIILSNLQECFSKNTESSCESIKKIK
jgi:hypothetical protein